MTVHYRPVARSALYLRQRARKLGKGLVKRGGAVAHDIMDGYLVRASAFNGTARVTAIDPAAVWLFCGYNVFGTGTWPTRSFVRQFTRDDLQPGDDTALAALTPTVDNALFAVATGDARTGNPPGGASVLSEGQVDFNPEWVVSTAVMSSGVYPAATRYVLGVASAFNSPVRAYGTSGEVQVRPVTQANYLFTEDYFKLWLGARFRFVVDLPDHTAGDSRSTLVSAPKAAIVDDVAYHDVLLATTCALQGPYDTGVSPNTNQEIERCWFIGQGRAVQQAAGSGYVARPLAMQWGTLLRASLNPDVDFRALPNPVYPGQFRQHSVQDVGVALSDDVALAVVSVARSDGTSTTQGVQVFRFNRTTGSYAWATASKVITLDGDTTTAKPLSFGLNRLRYRYIEPGLVGNEVSAEALATVAFTCTAEVDAASIELMFYDTTGVATVTGLGAAGYAPFWPKLSGYYTPWGHKDNLGYAMSARHGVVQDLGNNQLGVIAASRTTLGGGTVDWHLTVLDARDLSFVEVRGLLASVTNSTWNALSFSVVQRATATQPAVLLAWVFTRAGLGDTNPVSVYKLSRDGGVTWQEVFNGVIGPAFYLGNQLHAVSVGETL